MIIEGQKVKVKWNGSNRKHYESCGYIFTKSGDEFEVNVLHLTKSCKEIVKFSCDWCNKVFERVYHIGIKSENQFCDHKCYGEHKTFVTEQEKPIKICEVCGNKYKIEKHRYEKSKYCSDECRHKGHSLEMQGENHYNYKPREIVKCDWCNELIEREVWRIIKNTYNFCNKECQQHWYKNIYLLKEEVIERNNKLLISNIVDGKISTTKSKPQLLLNELLTNKEIKFTNEKQFGNYSFDVYLDDFDLLIEVNGGYWHCDNRFYNEINYESQVNRIMMDKKKNSFIKNNFNKNILYLWEFDLKANILLCEKLIKSFIIKNGIIDNYHSFNYDLIDNLTLSINESILVPYMDWDFNKLKEIIDCSVKEKVGRYDPEKHIIFNCEYCGSEKEQTVYVYNKSKHHYCSDKCRSSAKLIGQDAKSYHKCNCDNCEKEIEVKNYIYQKLINGQQKSITCSKECRFEIIKKQWTEKKNSEVI